MRLTKTSDQLTSLDLYGIKNAQVLWNLSPEELQEISLDKGMGEETSNQTLVVQTGKFTGRSPEDRFIVKDSITEKKVWWGKINKPFESENFDLLYDDVIDYLSNKELYVRDAYACAEKKYQLNIRCITEYPWSSLFVYNMFLRPTAEELLDFQEEWLVICAPDFRADPKKHGTRQGNASILNFSKKTVLVVGSAYTGEIKKGIFSALNFILPTDENVLSMHCSANVGKNGSAAIFFGLSGTGKTTLSADPHRKLIGDDEHGWTNDNIIFNFEGGCYAKVINLSEDREPDIYRAIRKGALLENVVFKENSKEIDFEDSTVTQNTRVSYPIHHIQNIQKPSVAGNPKNIFFLTCDAFGVLPPISKLTPGQAAYHFISGYTAKVAGTEAGVTEPVPSFSACFGAPFMPLHPTVYAEMLNKKMKDSKVNVWLINTGWIGGQYGVGSRIQLKYTRAMIEAALNGSLANVEYKTHPIFGLRTPIYCPNVPIELLDPINTWLQKGVYVSQSIRLAHYFHVNFEKFSDQASLETIKGGPLIDQLNPSEL